MVARFIHFHHVHSLFWHMLVTSWTIQLYFWRPLAQRPRQPPSSTNGRAGPAFGVIKSSLGKQFILQYRWWSDIPLCSPDYLTVLSLSEFYSKSESYSIKACIQWCTIKNTQLNRKLSSKILRINVTLLRNWKNSNIWLYMSNSLLLS